MLSESAIQDLIAFTYDCIGMHAEPITIVWSKRMTASGGRAVHKTRQMRLGVTYFDLATEEEQRQTVIHEACHFAVRDRWRNKGCPYPCPSSHGPEWIAFMVACGVPPKRCHSVQMPERPRTLAHCPCREHFLTAIRVNRMRRGQRYICRFCRQTIFLGPAPSSQLVTKD